MASSNRHWPSMFKSKPCTTHHQWQHDINPNPLMSSGCHRSSPYSSGGPGSDDRTPEPKPRWNPKPEQIRILEAIFNSGMVNPPRDEIRKIRAQLQEFGQVGDANVFYWFQNRKSRSKNKHRNLYQTSKQQKKASSSSKFSATTTTSSSSSSSEKSITADNINRTFSFGGSSNFYDRSSNSPTASVNQTYFQSNLIQEPFFFPVQQQNVNVSASHHQLMNHHNQGFEFSEIPNLMNQLQDHDHNQSHHQQQSGDHGACHGFLFSELMMNNNHHAKKLDDEETTMMMKFHQQQPLSFTNSISASPSSDVVPIITAAPMVVPSAIDLIQGVGADGSGVVTLGGGVGPAKSTVFINNVAVEVEVGPVNVREAFGEGAMLINSSSGQPVATDEWGVTLHPLEHCAFYYLI